MATIGLCDWQTRDITVGWLPFGGWGTPFAMQTVFRLGFAVALLLCPLRILRTQRLSHYADAFQHSPLTWSFFDGSINFNGALPSQGGKGEIQRPYL
jgi:hypothetical protein